MPVHLNADVLAIIATFLDTASLRQLSLVSRALLDITYPLLYADIHVSTLPQLLSVADTLARTPGLSAHVRGLTEAVSRPRPFYAGVAPAQWPAYLSALLLVLARVRGLTRLALSVPADFCGDAAAAHLRPKLLAALSGLPRLRSLAVSDVDFHALDMLAVCAPLRVLRLSPSHTAWTGSCDARVPERMDWITKMFGALESRHADTLEVLDIPYASVVGKPHLAHMRFARVATLIIPEGVAASPAVAACFPNLRRVRLGVGPHTLKDVDKVWPHLEHLELEACDAGLLSLGHRVRSLALRVEQGEFEKIVPQLASPHVWALKLRSACDAPPDLRALGALFPALRYVDVPLTLDQLVMMCDPEKQPCWATQTPSLSHVQVYEFTIQAIPPPAVSWAPPDPPLQSDFFTKETNKALRAIIVNWVDADFRPRSQAYLRSPSDSGAFVPGLLEEAVELANAYRYSCEWPRWGTCTL